MLSSRLMSDQGSDSEQRRDKLLLWLLKTPPQTRDQLKAERVKAKATRTRGKRASTQKTPPRVRYAMNVSMICLVASSASSVSDKVVMRSA